MSGRVHDVTRAQLIELARVGATHLEQQAEPDESKKEEEPEVEVIPDKDDYEAQLTLANKRIDALQKGRDEDKKERDEEKETKRQGDEQQAIFRSLEEEAKKYPELEKPALRKLIHKAVIAELVSGSKRNVSDLYKENAEELIAELPKKKKEHADNKISALLQQISRGGSEVNLDAEHVFKSKDVKSGKSLEAMRAFLGS